jgi:hypothetical protein
MTHQRWRSSFRALLMVAGFAAYFGAHGDLRAQGQLAVPPVEITYEEWRGLCAKLPTFKALQGRLPPRHLLPLQSFAELDLQLRQFFALSTTGTLASAEAWVGPIPAKSGFFNPARVYHQAPAIPFEPFAQKLMVPPDAEVFFHGDLHGDIHSLMDMLQWMNRSHYLAGFRFTRTNTYFIVLGDFTDRGVYSTEVLYTLLRLKLANPARVFLCRGNHEDASLMVRYGFLAEGRAKFGNQFDAVQVSRTYDFLPVVLYLGCGTNFLQCNHGGMEPGYRPATLLDAPGELRFQTIGPLTQKTFLTANARWFAAADAPTRTTAQTYYLDGILTSPTTPTVLGFMWNDFTLVKGQGQLDLDAGRGFVYGDELVKLVLTQSSSATQRVRAVFRAHQHSSVPNPMMNRLVESRGLFRHWQATDSAQALEAAGAALDLERGPERRIPEFSVWTFNVVPDSTYGIGNDFQFDTFGILRVAESFNDWKVRVVNQTGTN